MTKWRNLVASLAALALTPLPLLARAHSDRADPQSRVPGVVLIEYPASPSSSDSFPKVSAEKSGNIPAKDGGSLRLNVQLGDVHVFTDSSGRVSYRAIAEADKRDPGAQEFLRQFQVTARETERGVSLDASAPWQGLRGRFSVAIEIHVPRLYSLEITSGGGNIDVQDVDGRVSLTSAGGNIAVGRIGGADFSVRAGNSAAGKKTDRLKPVLREAARIETQGGQISVGDVLGTLRASTAGGHIITGNVTGDASLRTGGGQIYAGRIAGTAALDSGGGSIHLEGTGGSVAANAAGGEVVLKQESGPIHLTVTDGSITAWLADAAATKTAASAAEQKPRQTSQLFSTGGDIVLYLPRELAATIDATMEEGGGRRMFTDSSLPIQIRYQKSADGGRTMHCAAQLNGGGEIIRLKTESGNIVLRSSDPQTKSTTAFSAGRTQQGLAPASTEPANSGADENFTDADSFFAEMRNRILESLWGGVPVDAAEMQKHLEHSVVPVYPDVARAAGIEGEVVLRVYVSSDGRVTGMKILDGPPILARAAVQAVAQWRYQSPRIDGRPANVVTTLVVSFRLH
jgi:TonB family protein